MSLNQKYLTIIKHHYPQIKNYQLQVFDEGWDHLIVVVNQAQAFRFPQHPEYAKRLPVEVAFLHQFSSQSPLPVPQMTLRQSDQKSVYATHPFIPGVKFEKSVRLTFSQPEILAIAQQLGQFLTAIHSFSVTTAKQTGLQPLQQSYEYWSNRFSSIKHTVFPYLSKAQQIWVSQLFESSINTFAASSFEPVVSHGDITPGHLIVNPTGHTLAGIIDFGDISIGDPAYDFQLEHEFGTEFLQTVYRYYQLPKDSTFETRRRFYEYSFIIRKIENEINRGNKQQLEALLAELTEFIRRQDS